MSAITPKADMAWTIGDVRFVPLATKVRRSKKFLFDHFVKRCCTDAPISFFVHFGKSLRLLMHIAP